jgi:hypothetical protein
MSETSPDRDSLQALLGKVRERLSDSSSVDASSRELLRQVMGDIERTLDSGAGGATQPNTSRIEALAVRFEADHPSLAASLRQLAGLLNEVGI